MTTSLDIRPMTASDLARITDLHGKVLGPGRFARTAYRVRERAALRASSPYPLSRVGWAGTDIAAAVSMNPITIGGKSGAVLLGPLVVAPDFSGQGLGEKMVNDALDTARKQNVKLVLLVGDHSYYKRFGFEVVDAEKISMPGPVDPHRVLAIALSEGSLAEFSGPISA